MYLHANAKLGLAGRLALVRAIEGRLSLKAAAAAFSVSPATATASGIAGLMAAVSWWRCWTARAGLKARRARAQPIDQPDSGAPRGEFRPCRGRRLGW